MLHSSHTPDEPKTAEDMLQALHQEIKDSLDDLEIFRANRLEILKQIVGHNYSNNGSAERLPVNMIDLASDIYMNHLAANTPATLVSSPKIGLRSSASMLKLGLNHLMEEINFEDTIQTCVQNALVGLSPVRIGLNPSKTVEIGGSTHDVGQPFVDAIDLSDWVHDMKARSLEDVAFCGHRYRMMLRDFRASGLFTEIEKVQLLDEADRDEDYEEYDPRRISQGQDTESDRMNKYVELWDIWLPSEGLVITIQLDNIDAVFRQVEWDGPEAGPYRFLWFKRIPNNIMPLAPLTSLLDLQDGLNRVFNKLIQQAERQKTITFVNAGSEKNGQLIKDAEDGDMITTDDPSSVREAKYGGIDQENLMFSLQMKSLIAYFAGNLDTLGGLATQADTLGQEELLSAGATKKIRGMEKAVFKFVKAIVGDLAFYLWTDPLMELPLVARVGGRGGMDIPITYTPEMREGDFLDYNIKIEPHSMQHNSPQEKLQKINRFIQGTAIPMAPIWQQQGIVLDAQKLTDLVAEYDNIPELNDLFIRSTEPGIEQQPIGQARPGPTPSVTQNFGGQGQGSDGATQQLMAQALAGGRPQKEDVAEIGDPVV